MADIDFYSRNLHRRYPLIDESYGDFLNDDERLFSQIVDFGVVLYPESGFNPSDIDHKIYVSKYNILNSNKPELEFLIYAPNSSIDQKTITVTGSTDEDFAVTHFKLYLDLSITELNQPLGVFIGFGFVVFGKLSAFDGNSIDLTSQILSNPNQYAYIERRCIQSPIGHFVNKLEVANEPRTSIPNNTMSSSISTSNDYLIVPNSPAKGHVRFIEGYNCQIKVLSNLNALRFSAIRGAGQGEACTEIPRTEEEILLQRMGMPLDNSPRCNEVLTNINGIEPDLSGNFVLEAGNGIEIEKQSNKIIIKAKDSLEGCD